MGGVGLVHGLWVSGCVGIIPAPLAYQPVHWCCKRTTSYAVIVAIPYTDCSIVRYVRLLRLFFLPFFVSSSTRMRYHIAVHVQQKQY